jgi:hypothetical protein
VVVAVVVAGAAVAGVDVGETGGVGRIRVRGSFPTCPHQDGCCMSHASPMSDAQNTGSVSDSRHRSPIGGHEDVTMHQKCN